MDIKKSTQRYFLYPNYFNCLVFQLAAYEKHDSEFEYSLQ